MKATLLKSITKVCIAVIEDIGLHSNGIPDTFLRFRSQSLYEILFLFLTSQKILF